HAAVPIVGDVELVGGFVQREAERPTEVRLVTVGLTGLADLRHELAGLVELQHLRVGWRRRAGGRGAASTAALGIPASGGRIAASGWRVAPSGRRITARRIAAA